MHVVGVFEAKNRLTALLDEVEEGGEVLIHAARQAGGASGPGGGELQPRQGAPGGRRAARPQQGPHPGRCRAAEPHRRRSAVSFVLDNSVALAWCFEDEQTNAVMALLDRVVDTGAMVPQLWPVEALDGLLSAQRRGRIDAVTRERLAGFLRALPIGIDDETAAQVWSATVSLAERHRLTAYDATYLELALRLGLPPGHQRQVAAPRGNARGRGRAAGRVTLPKATRPPPLRAGQQDQGQKGSRQGAGAGHGEDHQTRHRQVQARQQLTQGARERRQDHHPGPGTTRARWATQPPRLLP